MYSITVVPCIVVVLVVSVSIQQATGNPTENYNQAVFSDKSHNLTIGHNHDGDRLLDYTEIKLDHKLLRWVEHDYVFPETQVNENKTARISSIKVEDLLPDGEGGYASVTTGGVGSNNVTIHLESRWNRGIDFCIFVYGTYIRRKDFENPPVKKIIYV